MTQRFQRTIKDGWGLPPSGLISVFVPLREVQALQELLNSKIRRISRLEPQSQEDLAQLCVAGRLLFELAAPQLPEDVSVELSCLSKEDVELLYALPFDARTEKVLKALNDCRGSTKSAGSFNPVSADMAAKSVVMVMDG